jgi:ribonuclease BN (tRNA processing enzyme)
MHKLTFFPLGNADTARIDLENGKKILIDYADMHAQNDASDKRIDLAKELRKDLDESGRNDFDVVAFTHFDEDHVTGAPAFFYLDHATKYQSEDRAKIHTLWVPAAAIIESRNDICEDARIIQAEARYRFEKGYGIRVFSKPNELKQWLSDKDIKLEDRLDLISDAGTIIPDFTLLDDSAEFFVHSPFVSTINATGEVVRNDECLTLHVTFDVLGTKTKVLFAADATHDVLANIVTITKDHQNEQRLEWDIMNIAHHSSYLSLSDEKGTDETIPREEVQQLCESYAKTGAIFVSTSRLVPSDSNDTQPPHRQTVSFYRRVAKEKGGEFYITMEHPTSNKPEPLTIEILQRGQKVLKSTSAYAAVSSPAPRAGRSR